MIANLERKANRAIFDEAVDSTVRKRNLECMDCSAKKEDSDLWMMIREVGRERNREIEKIDELLHRVI